MKFIVEISDAELDDLFPEAGEAQLCDTIADSLKSDLGVDDIKVTGAAFS